MTRKCHVRFRRRVVPVRESLSLTASTVPNGREKMVTSSFDRTTTRKTKIYAIPTQLLPLWAGAKHIIALVRAGRRCQGKKSRRRLVDFHESHYYLSSLDWSASQFSDAIRGRWLIENRLHRVKDVTLNEDNCIPQRRQRTSLLGQWA